MRAQSADPAIVLGRFLRALGVPATAVPDDPAERAEFCQSLLAERRIRLRWPSRSGRAMSESSA